MRANRWIASHRGRAVLLSSMAVGWTGLVFGAVTGRVTVVALGATIVALTNLVVAKVVLESRSSIDAVRRDAGRNERAVNHLTANAGRMWRKSETLEAKTVSMEPRIDRLGTDIADLTAALNEASASHTREIVEVQNGLSRLETAHDVTRTGLVATRALADKLAERNVGSGFDAERLWQAARSRVASPLLSIAIPSFNRPQALAELLASISREVASCPDGLIELCISDDASPDPETLEIALEFVEHHSFASLTTRPSNIGLERNVMAAAEPCRGDYLMVVGNDDLLDHGALKTILDDIETANAPVLLYGKRRINLDGSPRADVAGSIPIEVATGESHLFPTLIDASRGQGLLSTFGFAGPIVVRREPFLAVDTSPYMALTLYARACVLIEAFADSPVFYRNIATIVHRTQSPVEKHAEALGRAEEEFMSGGRTRLSRYFGTTLAAAMQRLIDRGALDYQTIASMPERLMSDRLLVDWIAHNRAMDPAFDDTLDPRIVEDSTRFFAALDVVQANEGR